MVDVTDPTPGSQEAGASSSASLVVPSIVAPLVGTAVLPTEGVAGGEGER